MISSNAIRRGLRIRGTVQGVGFRPFIHRLADEHSLSGFVRNDAEGVWIEVQGLPDELSRFESRLRAEPPPLALIVSIEIRELPLLPARGFRIVPSASASSGGTTIPVDAAPCDDCLRELFDPADRRYRYPFINCTACGPRYTLIRNIPYDRARTTMSAFELCAACRAEYENPRDRRFHAEPTACPACGPSLRLLEGPGAEARGNRQVTIRCTGDEALRFSVRAISDGEIVALKGVGGFLLAADARNAGAVARLRARKRRPHKPFAVMARNLEEVEHIADLSDAARRALTSAARPIVLLPLRRSVDALRGVAPGLREIGVMLPSTPLHALLLADGPPLQIMTSGNLAGEPIAQHDEDACSRLAPIADWILTHDRPIHTRLDDSVVRIVAGALQPVRRARGFVPTAIALPFSAPPALAVGADLKNAICITRGREAFPSQHIGDLASPLALDFFEETIAKLGGLLDVRPSAVAHDLHPEYRSARWAIASGLAREPVQHHHAHIASCLVDNGCIGPAIGIAFDGTGCGPDGDLWGGEILIADLASFRRAGHLLPIALAGGEAAIREPWRLGLAALLDAGAPFEAFSRIESPRRDLVVRMIRRRVATPLATGAGRWFDAIAAIVGIRHEISYEGQAAIELEAMAAEEPHPPYPFAFHDSSADGPFVVDLRPAVRAIAVDVTAGTSVAEISARFHETLAHAVVLSSRRLREESRLARVALSGGCFQNRRLTERVLELLTRDGFEVLLHRRVPPNDGGIALGQAAIAAYRHTRKKEGSSACASEFPVS